MLGSCQLFEHDAKKYSVVGIDVSHHQGLIDWESVADVGYDFVFMKATEGRSLRDKAFLHNWARAGDLGLRRGAYHFFRPGVPTVEQVTLFTNTVDLRPGDFPPVLDVEKTGGLPSNKLVKAIREWSAAITKHYGIKPIIYSGQNFYNRHLAGQLDDHYLWLARYDRDQPVTVCGRDYQFWQFSDRGKSRGIEGRVDKNVFTGTAEDWHALQLRGDQPRPWRAAPSEGPVSLRSQPKPTETKSKSPSSDLGLADFESY